MPSFESQAGSWVTQGKSKVKCWLTCCEDKLMTFAMYCCVGPNDLDAAALEAWENCLWHITHIRRSVEDLGAAMYPPQVSESN
jgi:hypothetical protein